MNKNGENPLISCDLLKKMNNYKKYHLRNSK